MEMRKLWIAPALMLALLAAACGGVEQAVESGVGAQVDPAPTPQQIEEKRTEIEIEPGVTPQPDWDNTEYPSATSLSSERLPNGLEIACSAPQVEIEDALAPDQIDHSKTVQVLKSRVTWWVYVDNPQYERAIGDDRLLSPFVLTVSEKDRVQIPAGSPAIDLPQILRIESLPGNGTQSALLGIDQYNSVAIALVEGSTGALTPISRCGGYNPLFRIAETVASESVVDAYLDLIGYPPARGLSPVDEATLLSALAIEQIEPQVTDWNTLDPSTRVIDDAPDEFKAGLIPFVIRVAVPESWVGDKDALLCTRSATGWNSCIALDAISAADYETVQAFPLEGLRAEGEDLQILLLNQDAAIRGIGSELGVLTSKQLDDSLNFVVQIETDSTPGQALELPDIKLSIVPDED